MKRLMKFAVIISIIIIACTANAGSVPSLVNYQGKLTDADGNGLNETKTIECSIYDAATGGNLVWGSQIFTNIALVNGMFNVILGNDSNGKLISSAFSSDARYLSIKIGGVEITPRQQILSTPFAISSEVAANAKSANVAVNTAFARLQNLRVANNTTDKNNILDISAEYVTLYDNNGYGRVLTIPSGQVTASMSKSGAGGLDTGSEASSKWYYVYLIYNPETNSVQSLLSISKTTPALPTGYTFFKRISAVYNDASYNFRQFWQFNEAVTVIDTNLIRSSSEQTGACNSLSIASWVPDIAIRINGYLMRFGNSNKLVRICSHCTNNDDLAGCQHLQLSTYNDYVSNFTLNIVVPDKIFYTVYSSEGEYVIKLTGYEIDL